MTNWEWDPAKDKLNRRRHKVGLDDGIPALSDHLAQSLPDPHPDGDRLQTIGSAAGNVILFVVHTDPVQDESGDEVGRIISVRKATKQEKEGI